MVVAQRVHWRCLAGPHVFVEIQLEAFQLE
jgi:hypothetical protein